MAPSNRLLGSQGREPGAALHEGGQAGGQKVEEEEKVPGLRVFLACGGGEVQQDCKEPGDAVCP